jgi:hypothetical protein
MSNYASFMINDPSGSHQIFLEQDAGMFTTIHALVDGSPHDLTSCSASSNGLSMKGKVQILFWTDDVALLVSPGAPGAQSTVTLIISGYRTFSGVLDADQAAELTAFLTAAKLPPLAE